MSQTPSPEEGTSPDEQRASVQGVTPYQTYSSEPGVPDRGHLDIGPGGVIIIDSPNNRELLERIERTSELTPIELYRLAVSYQQVVSTSGLGNRLAFVGLNAIFQNPAIQQLLHSSFSAIVPSLDLWCQIGCAVGNPPDCHCQRGPANMLVKSIRYLGLNLLIEITRFEERETYVILGVSPSELEFR